MSIGIPYPCHTVVGRAQYGDSVSDYFTVAARVGHDRVASLGHKPKGWKPPKPYRLNFENGMTDAPYLGYYSPKIAVRGYDSPVYDEGTVAANCSGYYYSPAPAIPRSMIDYAELGARLKLKNQKVNLADAFAERKQTADMFVSTASRVASLARACHRRDFSAIKHEWGVSRRKLNAVKSAKTPAQAFLEMKYGWQPLMSDLYGSVDALRSKDYEDPGRYIVNVKSGKIDRYQESKELIHSPSGTNCSISVTNLRDIEMRTLCHLSFYLDNPVVASMSALGVTNPLVVAWEVTPWSFVADWFLPIGNYLSSLDATLGYTFKGGSVTMFVRVNGKCKIGPSTGSYGQPLTVFVNGDSYRQVTMERFVYTTAPVPSLGGLFNPGGLHGGRIANAIALVVSSIRSR